MSFIEESEANVDSLLYITDNTINMITQDSHLVEVVLKTAESKTHLSSTAQQNIVWSYNLEPNTLEQHSAAQQIIL